VELIVGRVLTEMNLDYVNLEPRMRNLLIDGGNTTKKFNNLLLSSLVYWTITENEEKLKICLQGNFLARHGFDHYNVPHYHVFKNSYELYLFQLYCLKRTWIESYLLNAGGLLTEPRRVNFGLQVLTNAKNDKLYNKLLASSILLIFTPILRIDQCRSNDFYNVMDVYISKNFQEIIDLTMRIKHQGLFYVPYSAAQLGFCRIFNLLPIETRIIIDELEIQFNEKRGPSQSGTYVTNLPLGDPVNDLTDVVVSKRIGTSLKTNGLFILDLPFSKNVNTVIELFVDRPVNAGSVIIENDYLSNKIVYGLGLAVGYEQYLQLFGAANLKQLDDKTISFPGVGNSLARSILLAYRNNVIPDGIASLVNGMLSVTGLSLSSVRVLNTPLEFWNTIQLSKWIEYMYNDQNDDESGIFKLNFASRVLFVNQSTNHINLTKLLPNLRIAYRRTNSRYVGDLVSMNNLLTNVGSELIFYQFSTDEINDMELVTLFASLFKMVGAMGVVTLFNFSTDRIAALTAALDEEFDGYEKDVFFGIGNEHDYFGLAHGITFILGSKSDGAPFSIQPYFWESGQSMQEQLWKYVKGYARMKTPNSLYYGLAIRNDFNVYLNEFSSGQNFSLIGPTSASKRILGVASSISSFTFVTKEQRDDVDILKCVGTTNAISRAISNRRGGYLEYQDESVNLLDYATNEVKNVFPPISIFEMVTQGYKNLIFTLRVNSFIAGRIDNPLIDIGSENYTSIYLTTQEYHMIDRDVVPTLGMIGVDSFQFTIEPKGVVVPEDPFTEYLLFRAPRNADVLIFNSVYFIKPGELLGDDSMFLNLALTYLINMIKHTILEVFVIQRNQDATIYLNLPYCNDSIYDQLKYLVDIERVINPIDPTPDDEFGYRYTVKFSSHSPVIAFNETELTDFVTELEVDGFHVSLELPSIHETVEGINLNGRGMNTISGSTLTSLMNLTPLLVITR
jgi:hypothetical protein